MLFRATSATSATSATNATTAANANALQGKLASDFAPSTIEAAHIVGASGQPAYQNGWGTGALASVDEGASFYKDPWGIVHVQGNVGHSGASTLTIFTLPVGYRPAKNLYFAVYGSGGTSAFIQVLPDGTVNPFGPSTGYYGLSTITFRAGL